VTKKRQRAGRGLEMQQSKKATSYRWPIAEGGYAGQGNGFLPPMSEPTAMALTSIL